MFLESIIKSILNGLYSIFKRNRDENELEKLRREKELQEYHHKEDKSKLEKFNKENEDKKKKLEELLENVDKMTEEELLEALEEV